MSGRVWDPYLSASDRQWLATRTERPLRLGASPALLMIDLYRGGFGDEPQALSESVKRWPWSCGMNGWNALPHIVELLAAARRARIPIIHSTMRDNADGLAGWMDTLHARGAGTLAGHRADGDARRAREIIPEAAPLVGEAVIEKTAPSAFAFTPLLAHLRDLGVDTVLVAGMATSGCVRASVVDGVAHRYRMVVVEPCVFDRLEASHALSLFDIGQKYGDVVGLDTAVSYLEKAER
jgi:maleamate amidohydrolase